MLKLRTLFILLPVLFILSACGTDIAPEAPAGEVTTEATGVGLEFRVDPETEEVTVIQPEIDASTTLQTQADGDIRLLVQGQDIRFKDFSFQFRSPDRLVVRLRVENITDDLNFTQPFFFTLSSTSQNIVAARAPLVTDAQLGGDGVLSPGETSKRFRFVVTFREDEPFTFFVDANAKVVATSGCTNPVTIPDTQLERAVRDELDKPEGELTCDDLASLETLDTQGVGRVTNLAGLQFAVNLTNLSLAGDDVSDLTPIADLTNLTTLNLNFNGLSDLSPLENLTSLSNLFLSENNITDISALVANSGLGEDDTIDLTFNPLSSQALEDIETLQARGVEVFF